MNNIKGLECRYVVKDNHTLGIIYDRQPHLMSVMAGSVIRGGHDWKNGPVAVDPNIDNIRPATLSDFDFYRVCPKGHLTPV